MHPTLQVAPFTAAGWDFETKLDGFRALDGLDVSVRVAVASEEGPAELRGAADLTVRGPEGLLTILRRL